MFQICRLFSLLTCSQVDRRIFKPDKSEAMSNRLMCAVEALSQLQTRIHSTPAWCSVFDDQATVQRAYIWTMDRIKGLGLGDKVGNKLKSLIMDVSNASQEMLASGDKG